MSQAQACHSNGDADFHAAWAIIKTHAVPKFILSMIWLFRIVVLWFILCTRASMSWLTRTSWNDIEFSGVGRIIQSDRIVFWGMAARPRTAMESWAFPFWMTGWRWCRWWLKSYTTETYTISASIISTGSGFLPSTAVIVTTYHRKPLLVLGVPREGV